jgi:cell wall-associated NlpC family hydrolase
MQKHKRALLALVVAAAITSTTQSIAASTNVNKTLTGTSNSIALTAYNAASVDENNLERFIPEKKPTVKVEKVAAVTETKVVKPTAIKNVAVKSKPAATVTKTTASVKKSNSSTSSSSKKTTASKTTTSKTTRTVASRGKAAPVPMDKADAVIDYAKQFMGIKYVFGGSTPSGFDCSGFTMYVFKKINIDLPHSASAQASMGIAVSKSELMPGDLVFFQTYKKGISHVGIYIGGGQFIEASSSRGIAVTSLSSSYYAPRYMGATRIIK